MARAQVLSGPYTHKDLDGVPTVRPSNCRKRLSKSLASIARRKLSIICDSANPSPGVMPPRPTASATALIAPRMSAALLIGGRDSSTERSRRGATVRSRQSRKAVGSPARASSTALRLSAVASPSSSSCAARVDRSSSREAGWISGLPLRKRSTSNPFNYRCCFLQRNISHRSTSIGHRDARRRMPFWRAIPCDYSNFVVAA